MKTPVNNLTKAAIVASLVFASLFGLSNTKPDTGKKVDKTEKSIRDYFKFPQILIPQGEVRKNESYKIEVLFTTDKNGKVNFVLVKTNDKILRAEIEKQFLNLRLTQIKSEVVHSVMLNFKTV